MGDRDQGRCAIGIDVEYRTSQVELPRNHRRDQLTDASVHSQTRARYIKRSLRVVTIGKTIGGISQRLVHKRCGERCLDLVECLSVRSYVFIGFLLRAGTASLTNPNKRLARRRRGNDTPCQQ